MAQNQMSLQDLRVQMRRVFIGAPERLRCSIDYLKKLTQLELGPYGAAWHCVVLAENVKFDWSVVDWPADNENNRLVWFATPLSDHFFLESPFGDEEEPHHLEVGSGHSLQNLFSSNPNLEQEIRTAFKELISIIYTETVRFKREDVEPLWKELQKE